MTPRDQDPTATGTRAITAEVSALAASRGNIPLALTELDSAADGQLDRESVRADLRQVRANFTRFMLAYRAGMEQVESRVQTLREEYLRLHDDTPIEHVSMRLKSPESLLDKAVRKGLEPSLKELTENVTDIAGVRVTCAFVSDTYRVFRALTQQADLEVRTVKDYIANPKPNGYRSLHVIVDTPVYLTSGAHHVPVEIQFRTVAMDFWASLEHRIHYKYRGEVPGEVRERLTAAALASRTLDAEMEELNTLVHGPRSEPEPSWSDDAGPLWSPISESVVQRILTQVPAEAFEPASLARSGGEQPSA